MRPYKGLKPVDHEDGIYWSPKEIWDDPRSSDWRYAIAQYAFVPGYNVVDFGENYSVAEDWLSETVISNHKTLTEAKAILMILLATPGAINYGD